MVHKIFKASGHTYILTSFLYIPQNVESVRWNNAGGSGNIQWGNYYKYHALNTIWISNQAFGKKYGKEGPTPREEELTKDKQTILVGWDSKALNLMGELV